MSDRTNPNKEGIAGYRKKILGMIDQSQVDPNSHIGTDFEPITRDPAFPTYGKLDPTADSNRPYSDANPIIPKSMNRYCKDHTDEIYPATKVQGNRTAATPKHAKTDSPADSGE